MADYKETLVEGKAWQRAQLIIISNHLGQIPTVHYQEEEIIKLGDKQLQSPVGSGLSYTIDPTGAIALRDVETLELTGMTIPVALVHQALFSDYINRALDRDSATPLQPEA